MGNQQETHSDRTQQRRVYEQPTVHKFPVDKVIGGGVGTLRETVTRTGSRPWR